MTKAIRKDHGSAEPERFIVRPSLLGISFFFVLHHQSPSKLIENFAQGGVSWTTYCQAPHSCWCHLHVALFIVMKQRWGEGGDSRLRDQGWGMCSVHPTCQDHSSEQLDSSSTLGSSHPWDKSTWSLWNPIPSSYLLFLQDIVLFLKTMSLIHWLNALDLY